MGNYHLSKLLITHNSLLINHVCNRKSNPEMLKELKSKIESFKKQTKS